MVARLSTAIGRHEAALEARNLALAADGIKRLTEVAKSRVQLEILEKDMATRDFFAYFSALVIPLTCADSSDDRSYALVRGTVWSCARDLEPTQWSIFVDRFFGQQPMEVTRFSRRSTVECKPKASDRGAEITFRISALAASFVSSEAIASQEAVNDNAVLQITSEPVRLTREDKSSELEYALYRGVVWECRRPLLPEQWRALADSRLAEEETALAQELTQALSEQPPSTESIYARQGIPTAVRRAVWARDNGRCVQCSSKEWLEYDHMIPVSKGGSNTERNIELLCEACNRAKADSIS